MPNLSPHDVQLTYLRQAMFCLLGASASLCAAQEVDFSHLDMAYEPLPVKYFDTTADVKFSTPQLALKMFLIGAKKNRRTNHFCVIGYEWADGRREAPVFWKEGKEIMWWDGGSTTSWEDVNSIRHSKSNILGKDTVETFNEIRGSTYLMVRSGMEAIIRDCKKNGKWYVVKPFKAPPACKSYDECQRPGVNPLSQRWEQIP
jgi:hypothetical protein